MRTSRAWLAGVLPVLCVAGIVGCGSSSSSSSTGSSSSSSAAASSTAASSSSPAADPAVAAKVPAAIKSKGTLNVASDATYAPNEFIGPDGKTVIGMDADLMKALAGVMGLKVNIANQTSDFNNSSGVQIQMATKRGTNAIHGSA